MRAERLKSYIAVFVDEEGDTYEYVASATRRRDAEQSARESAGQWGATLIELRPAVVHRPRRRRKRIALAIVAAAGIAIAAIAIVGTIGSTVL